MDKGIDGGKGDGEDMYLQSIVQAKASNKDVNR